MLFAAVLSPTGGARKLFLLGEAELLELMVGPNVLREADEVVRRKAPASLPLLAQLLEIGKVQTVAAPTSKQIELLVEWSCMFQMRVCLPKPSAPKRIGL